MVYHSTFNETDARQLCSMSLLPIKSKFKGPAPPQRDESQPDIIDEALDFFKANVLFRNFEVQGPADRLLIYLTWYIREAIIKCEGKNKADANKILYQLAIENFAIPGDRNFPFGGFFANPTNRQEADQCRAYFTQLRQETNQRLWEKLYAQDQNEPSKWWTCFSKRKFLGV